MVHLSRCPTAPALSTFACYPIDDRQGPFPEMQQVCTLQAVGMHFDICDSFPLVSHSKLTPCIVDRLWQATWRYGYWVRDMDMECYSGMHLKVYVPIGIVAVLIFCVAPPVASFLFIWQLRNRLEELHIRKVYGFLYKRYK